MTAAMCQGNKLEKVRDDFPDRFFDIGICESHAVAFAAGLAKAGLRPIVDIYTTFLQRCFDQIFQEVALQNLPVVVHARPRRPDRARRPDAPRRASTSPTCGCSRTWSSWPPATSWTCAPMLDFALQHDGPVSIRYPKANVETDRAASVAPIELGQAEVLRLGRRRHDRRLRHAAGRLPARPPSCCATKGSTSASSTPASSSRSIAR